MNRINCNRPNRPLQAAGMAPDASRQGVASLACRWGRPRMAFFSMRIAWPAILFAAIAAPLAAQDGGADQADGLFPGLNFGQVAPKTEASSEWSATLVPTDVDGEFRVEVDVRLGPGWHLYSLTQPAGGPKRTRLTLAEPKSAELVEPWAPNQEPKRSVSDDFGGLTVEEHEDAVRFAAVVRLPAGQDHPVRISVDAQICNAAGACIPVRENLVAVPAGGPEGAVGDPDVTAPGSAPAGDTAGDPEPSRQVEPASEADAATEITAARGKPFRDGDYVVQWRAELAPATAPPGARVALKFTGIPDPTFHLYTAAVDDSSSATNFVVSDKADLKVGAPVTATPIVESDVLPGITYHDGDVTWVIPVEIPADAEPGKRTIRGFIVYQACTDTSCQQPMAFAFAADLMVAADAPDPAEGDAPGEPAPVRLVSAMRAEALDLAATSKWVDELPAGDDARGPAAGRPAPADMSDLGDPPSRSVAGDADDAREAIAVAAPGDGGLMSLPVILLLAFVGGVILNFMPCVLPVVGLKVMGFIKQAGEDRRRVLILNLAYIGGILSMFALFALLASTISLGWGQQLTYFPVRLGLTLALFALALSYFGVWEIPVPGFAAGQASQEMMQREGLPGAFAKGIFATILATPCSGPMLGYILGLTLTLSAPMTFLIILTVGLGMSMPYLIVGLRPGLIGWLPKPGPWMETMKQGLAFLFLATVAFFFATFSDQHKLPVFISLIAVWFGCWLIGRVSPWDRLAKQLFAWGGGIAVATLISVGAFRLTGQEELMEWEPYTEARLVQLQNQGRTVLLDFGAKWCGNCIYNYETALNTDATRRQLERLGAVAMYADWTDSNPEIEAKLREFDSISIPLLVIYPGDDPNNPIVLRDIVTQSQVLAALDQAGPSVGSGDMVATTSRSDRTSSRH